MSTLNNKWVVYETTFREANGDNVTDKDMKELKMIFMSGASAVMDLVHSSQSGEELAETLLNVGEELREYSVEAKEIGTVVGEY